MTAETQVEVPQYPAVSQTVAVAALVLGWLVPGAGHFLLKRWGRGALLAVSVFTMFVLGVLMQGKVYAFNTGDILDILGFVGDIGAGALYMVTRAMDWGQGAIQIAAADYGTKYIIVAGLLNIICAVDAYSIAQGKKP
jgi:hypothetical protein